MIDFQLNIGEVATYSKPARYTCFGLGSCVALFLHDRLTGHSGGAHIFLPATDYSNFELGKFYSVKSALDELLRQLGSKGNSLASLRAKIVGGANVLNSTWEVGNQNVDTVLQELNRRKIYVAAVDVGGHCSRTARFESNSGELMVRISSTNQVKIY